jgi:AcrR family transcriptional regulator
MRRKADGTKAKILTAAKDRFAAVGYQAATIRAIAADADIDPSMVMRYFGNKEKLFAAAAEFDLSLPDFDVDDPDAAAAQLVEHFLQRWESDDALVVLLRSSTTNTEAAQRMQDIFVTQLAPVVAKRVPPERAAECAGLIATQMLGLAMCRFVLQLAPVVAMSRTDLIANIGPTIQSYLDGRPSRR